MRHSLTQGHYIGIVYAINMHLYIGKKKIGGGGGLSNFFFWGGGLEPPKPHTRTAPVQGT